MQSRWSSIGGHTLAPRRVHLDVSVEVLNWLPSCKSDTTLIERARGYFLALNPTKEEAVSLSLWPPSADGRRVWWSRWVWSLKALQLIGTRLLACANSTKESTRWIRFSASCGGYARCSARISDSLAEHVVMAPCPRRQTRCFDGSFVRGDGATTQIRVCGISKPVINLYQNDRHKNHYLRWRGIREIDMRVGGIFLT